MADFDFYRGPFGGEVLSEEEFARFAKKAQAVLEGYQRSYRLEPVHPEADSMAVCQMAEVLCWFDGVKNGAGPSAVSLGSLSTRPAAKLPEAGPRALSKELYRAAGLYFDIFRGA